MSTHPGEKNRADEGLAAEGTETNRSLQEKVSYVQEMHTEGGGYWVRMRLDAVSVSLDSTYSKG